MNVEIFGKYLVSNNLVFKGIYEKYIITLIIRDKETNFKHENSQIIQWFKFYVIKCCNWLLSQKYVN